MANDLIKSGNFEQRMGGLGAFLSPMWSWLRPNGGGDVLTVGRQDGVGYDINNKTAAKVDNDRALQETTLYACINLIATTIAGLDLKVYQRTDNGDEEVKSHPLIDLIKRPNNFSTKFNFFEDMLFQLELNGFALCTTTKVMGRIRSLVPVMHSQNLATLTNENGGTLKYQVIQPDGSSLVLSQDEVFVVRHSGNGVMGRNWLQYAKKDVALALAIQQTWESVYRYGGKAAGAVKYSGNLTPDQKAAINNGYESIMKDQRRLLVLETGMEYQNIQLTPQELNLIEARKHQAEVIATRMGVPLALLGEGNSSSKTASALETTLQAFYKMGLAPRLKRLEDAIDFQLLNENDRKKGLFCKFDLQALLSQNQTDQIESLTKAVNGSLLTPNEAREIMGYRPMADADELLAGVNLTPMDMLGTDTANRNNALPELSSEE